MPSSIDTTSLQKNMIILQFEIKNRFNLEPVLFILSLHIAYSAEWNLIKQWRETTEMTAMWFEFIF